MQNSIKTFFRVGAEDFKKIPGSPIAYWITPAFRELFRHQNIEQISAPRRTLQPGDMPRFTRFWFEISLSKFSKSNVRDKKWYAMSSGGEQRKWYGNLEAVVNWERNGAEIKASGKAIIPSEEKYFQESLGWSRISTGKIMMRYYPAGLLHGDATGCIFDSLVSPYILLSYFNTPIATGLLTVINPTITFTRGAIASVPMNSQVLDSRIEPLATKCVQNAKADWDSYETSWDFRENPLIRLKNEDSTIKPIWDYYSSLRLGWKIQCEAMRQLEVENNKIFIEAYGLREELSPNVPWNEITLTCNPWYRYGQSPSDFANIENSFYISSDGKSGTTSTTKNGECPQENFPFVEELENRLLQDTIKEFISYAVGCMMGRYSPEKPGLILANQGSGVDDYFRIMGDRDAHIAAGERFAETTSCLVDEPYSQMKCCGTTYHHVMDSDGVIPILDDEWFMDDIVAQFKAFLTFTFGEENFTQNLQFIEGALGKDLRKYFIKDFYKEHVQRYKKRPIYWLFSSPNGSFNALIYMHRYRPDTVSIVLNDYLREYMTKLGARREHLIAENNRADLSSAVRTRNLKLIDKYASMLAELEAYERDILFPLAQKKIAIDLDDGVKVNYCKFGDALKKIPGLAAKEE